MSSMHPHDPHRAHPQARHPRRMHRRRRPRPRRTPGYFQRAWQSTREFLSRAGKALFRTRSGRLSRPKLISLGIVAVGLLYVLLVRGFLPFDLASPWLESALERQLGPGHRVSIRRTSLEHDESGSPVLRVHRIRVRGPSGKLIASAPTAEVGLHGGSLLLGSFQARRIDLVGAQTKVHVDADGRVAISAARDTVTPPSEETAATSLDGPVTSVRPVPSAVAAASGPAPVLSEPFQYPQLVRWLDLLEKSGLDGVALSQIGLKRGSLVVESAADGRTWTFDDINIEIVRPPDGGLLVSVASSTGERKWDLTATIGPLENNERAIDVVARNIAPGDIMLAAGLSNADLIAQTPLSGILRARIAQDGGLISAQFRADADGGMIGSATDAEARFRLDDLQIQAQFDAAQKAVIVEPVVQFGGNRIALTTVIAAPKDGAAAWPFTVTNGMAYLSSGSPDDPPLILDRVSVRGAYDPTLERVVVQQGSISGATASGAFSGSLSLGAKPMLALGMAASEMPASAAKRLWPALVARGTRGWAMERVEQGTINRIVIALNVPLDAIGKADVELPDAAVRLEMAASNVAFRPAADVPVIRDAEVNALVTGRTAHVRIAKGTMLTPLGRRIAMSDGVLEVPDHAPPNPNGSIRFRFDGAADAIAEMAATDLLKNTTGLAVNPATAKGTVSANVHLDLVFRTEMRGEEVNYAADVKLQDFGADGIVRGQRVEGVAAKLTVTPEEVIASGEGRIAGAVSNFEYKESKTSNNTEFLVSGTVDDQVRRRAGMDLAPWMTGPLGLRAQGRINDRETRINVEADLTATTINDLVPGWQKPAGRTSKATFEVVSTDKVLRLDNLHVSGSGTNLRGSLELDQEGKFLSANLPTFELSDGDKATLRAERAADGTLRVSVRGDVLDARGAIRSLTESSPEPGNGQEDLDLDLRLGVATGHNGEVARQVEMKLVRRNAEIRNFSLLGKIGRDASLVGEMRAGGGGRPVVYVTAGDAGALLRFADFYNKMHGGQARIMVDAPRASGSPQEGVINVSDFVIRGEPGLDRMQAAVPADATDSRAATRPASQGVPFLRMQVDFTRTPGRFNVREGVIYGPHIGATVDGVLDYASNRIHLRGTYIPAYSLNNLFGQLPIVGLFLGGPKEGLFAITFEIVGPVSGPTLRVNPMSAAAPGLLRKLFEFRGAADAAPPRQPSPQAPSNRPQ